MFVVFERERIFRLSVHLLGRLIAIGLTIIFHYYLIFFSRPEWVVANSSLSKNHKVDGRVNVVFIAPLIPFADKSLAAQNFTVVQSGENLQKAETDPKLDEISDTIPKFAIVVNPENHYFPVSEVNEKPQVVQDIPLDLGIWLTDKAAKKALVKLKINDLGEVDEVIISESFFSEKDLGLLIEEFKKMKFKPAKIGRLPVKSEMLIEIVVENTSLTDGVK